MSACSVKLGIDLHIIFGGEKKVNNQQISVKQVVKINTTEEKAYELNPMNLNRVSHDCELVNSSVVLVSGGLAQRGADHSAVLPDELYNITSPGEVIKVLAMDQSLQRIQHVLIRTGDQILALGGRDSNNNVPSKIAEFNPTTNSWGDLNQELHSKETSELVVTQYPQSSLDCVRECHCGMVLVNEKERIYGGKESKVRNPSSV